MPSTAIRDAVATKQLLHATPATTVREAARLMGERCCSSIAVVADGRLVGVFTESDAMQRVIARGLDPDRTPLAEVMTREPTTITPTTSVAQAIRIMHEFGFHHLPVVDEDVPTAMIAWRDLPLNEIVGIADELERRRELAEHMM